MRSGGSTWLLPARGFFIGCGAGLMAAAWHLTNGNCVLWAGAGAPGPHRAPRSSAETGLRLYESL